MKKQMRYKVIVMYRNGKVMTRDNHGVGYEVSDPRLLRLVDRLNEDDDVENIEVVLIDAGKEAQ